MSGWGERIKEAREAAGLSQVELASSLNKDGKTVYRYETERTAPDILALLKIAEMTGRSVQWLATGEDAPAAANNAKQEKPTSRIENRLLSRTGDLSAEEAKVPQLAVRSETQQVHPGIVFRTSLGELLTVDFLVTGRKERVGFDIDLDPHVDRDSD